MLTRDVLACVGLMAILGVVGRVTDAGGAPQEAAAREPDRAAAERAFLTKALPLLKEAESIMVDHAREGRAPAIPGYVARILVLAARRGSGEMNATEFRQAFEPLRTHLDATMTSMVTDGRLSNLDLLEARLWLLWISEGLVAVPRVPLL